jgi:signal transduction histidine kinase
LEFFNENKMEDSLNISCQKDTERIKALKKYEILDTPPDGSFDQFTKLAAKLLDVPIALISLVDTDRIWFKSRFGLDVSQIDRDPGLCASVILSDKIYLVEDALTDIRTLANPLVAGKFGLRFYAAIPLKVREGYNLGTFCVIDKKPRKFTTLQTEILQSLANMVIDQMELRLATRTAIYNQNRALSIFTHDLKNPLASIVIATELITEEKNKPQPIDDMCKIISEAGRKMINTINVQLETAREEASKINLRLDKLDFAKLIKNVVTANQILANKKNQKLQINIKSNSFVLADENKLTEIVDNLINNAIKYSQKKKNIVLTIRERNSYAVLEVCDEGPGLSEEDKKNLFQRFTRLSAQPTGEESSTGLGLSIVKALVEAHNGIVWAESEGKDKGSKFVVEIPVI